ncbi:hypothetical protein NE236_18620 [Actinoallomurus purpureus]|uniref:hypothetical protein n=1 Tax=Actinoallomurus purpureus TaxID=478114 RepID=UPI0020931F1B|nr:hypothetical protein [Actinoallomurus purpureus]MCO6007005.1 hypothetical protein [Actinoallomurus purpureus]
MIRRLPLTGLTLAAAVVAGAGPAIASAAQPPAPGYRCHVLHPHGDGAWMGRGNCLPFHGAPHRGPIFGTFTLTGHSPEGAEKTVTCRAHEGQHSGFAEVPVWVRGFRCD